MPAGKSLGNLDVRGLALAGVAEASITEGDTVAGREVSTSETTVLFRATSGATTGRP